MRNSLAAALVGVIFVGPVLAEPVFGTWKTIPDDNGRFGILKKNNVAKSFAARWLQVSSRMVKNTNPKI